MPLRAGPLSLRYEQGDLRYIRLGAREVLRRVYVAVRDRNWGTVPAVLSNTQIDARDHSFEITYDVSNRQGEIDFTWKGSITGGADGTITFALNGEARSTFLRNRIGFCVLHPVKECAGLPCEVEHSDGSVEHGNFPRYISPHQPFLDIRSIAHEVTPGVRSEVMFEGDVFEMEDQRNWTDASYKTYCTPIEIPYPVEVTKGTCISQSVTLTLHGQPSPPAAETEESELTLTIGDEPVGALPRVGLGVASHGQPLTGHELARLRLLVLGHLHVGLDLSRPGYEDTLRRAAGEAGSLEASLLVALTLTNPADELETFLSLLDDVQPNVCGWLLFQHGERTTPRQWLEFAQHYLWKYDPTVPVGGGTDAYFTQLNRDRPEVDAMDFVSYSINPQVHAFDNLSLVETLQAQAFTVESARTFTGDAPLYITPVTLRPRFNPSATGPERELGPGELLPQVDLRQMSLFGAAWTLGSLKYLAESGVRAVTYYETTGWRGVMETSSGSPAPEPFRSIPGAVFPLYHILADAGELADGELLPVTSSAPLKAEGLAIRTAERTRLLVANLTAQPRQVRVRGIGGPARVRYLHETNVLEAMTSPEEFRAQQGEPVQADGETMTLNLLPYAVARLDIVNDGAFG
ncbi:MAG: hypothetical protein M3Q29_07720 [Chloroflexota bacterium]|nr:hypothetical protein [Chloroflexota bacterium]